MTASKILFFLCISFVAGIFLESLFKTPQLFVWISLFSAVLLIFLSIFLFVSHFPLSSRSWFRGQDFAVVGFCILFLVLGVLRLQIDEFNVASDKLSQLNGKGQVVLQGTISGEPDTRENSQKVKIKVGDSTILVTTNKYPEYKYLDEIKLTGRLEAPAVFDDFNYKNYLMKDHIYSVTNFPQIEIISQKHNYNALSFLYEKILFLKQKMRQAIQNNFLPPQSQVLQGIILGDKGAVGQDIKDKFKITGLSHVIAVSGMHVAVLSTIVMAFLLFLGLWRQQAFWSSVIFICVYIVLVGLPSSAIRAGIMAIIYLSGQALGRQTASTRVIILAAAFMLLLNPLLLFHDVGFQLSFLAVLGLIYFEPILRSFVKFLLNKLFKIKLKEKYESAAAMLTVTISAQIFTLPIIIYNFGTVSFISPLTNILIVPIIFYVILFGFLSSLTGIVLSWLGWLVSVPCYFLMLYFLWIIDFFAKPWAYKIISNVSQLWLLFSYLIIGFVTWFLNGRCGRLGDLCDF